MSNCFTVRETVVEFIKMPEVPVMVTVAEPVAAVLLAVRVRVLVAPAGVKEAVTPLGKLEAEKLTLELNPFCGVTVMVLAALAP